MIQMSLSNVPLSKSQSQFDISKKAAKRKAGCVNILLFVRFLSKMCGLGSENPLEVQIKLIRKYLKLKIMADNVSFRGHSQERDHIYDLFKRTVSHGESHSALMLGPRGCGKTTVSTLV